MRIEEDIKLDFRDVLNGVAMFVPWNTGLTELHLVKDLHIEEAA